MFGDNRRDVAVKSNVSGAEVNVNGVSYGDVPTSFALNGTEIFGSKVVRVEKAGYKAQVRDVKTSFQMVSLLNILNFPIGFIIDAVTGNILKVDTKQINVTMKKK
tara:strand:- start:108 stop:422 length:315 start_codon:yes stop_codon:yes gene_type:complete